MSAPDFYDETSNALAEAGKLNFLTGDKMKFERHGAHLRLFYGTERCFTNVHVCRSFPLSMPDQYISVREGEKIEIGLIRKLTDLNAEQRQIIEEELKRRYVIPIITKVHRIKERFGVVDWSVDTNRGRRDFTTRDMRENVTRPSPGRYVLTDVDGNRYDIPNMDEMDGRSREQMLEVL
jgi:hypothetical protein